MSTIQDYLNQIKNAIYGKDVRQAIHDGIQQCYYDGKAGATDLSARQRLDTAEPKITSLESRMSTAETDIDVLDSRVDQIVAPSGEAPSAAEVSDARVGANGTTYTSLGAAVRGQVSDLKNSIDGLNSDVYDFTIKTTGISPAPGWRLNESDGLCSSNSDYQLVKYQVTAGTKLKIVSDDRFQFQNSSSVPSTGSNNRVGDTTYGVGTFILTVPTGATYLIFSTPKDDSDIAVYTVESAIEKNETAFMREPSFVMEIYPIDKLLTLNGFINATGQFNSNSYYKASDYIRVTQGQKIKYNLRDTTTTCMIAFYTDMAESTFDSENRVLGTGAYSSGTFTAPSNGYIRIACENYNLNLAYCYTEIEPNKRNFGGDAIEKSLNVLLMGDSIFGNDGEIASYLSELCKSCVNGAFGGTQVSVRPYTSDAFRFFDGVNIITALCNQVWTDQDSAATTLSGQGYTWVPTRLAGLKAVDMSEIDLLIMNWGTNDYTAGATIETIITAYDTVIDLLQETFPELRILVTTPIWRYWGTESDNENGDTKIYNVSTLKEIALAIEEFMKNKRISVLNAYQNLPLSYNTATTYFDSGDKTHLNTFGNKVYAQLLHGKIRSIY